MNAVNSPRDFFSKHAEDYSKSESHAHGSDLARLIELLRPNASEIALDVATGTGFTAMEVAKHAGFVVASDITKEMLTEARKMAREEGKRERKGDVPENLSFEEAEATHLPHPNASFDIITTRRAPHHFGNVPGFLSEARRVLNLGGRLGVVDMAPLEGSEEFFNRIERARDSTHKLALTQSEWKKQVTNAGLTVIHSEILKEEVTLERWMYPVKMGGQEEAEIRDLWSKISPKIKEIADVKESEDGELKSWLKTRIILIAMRQFP